MTFITLVAILKLYKSDLCTFIMFVTYTKTYDRNDKKIILRHKYNTVSSVETENLRSPVIGGTINGTVKSLGFYRYVAE